MNVLGIYGSPRKGGNSDLLLDRALEGARSAGVETISICARDLKISGCDSCGACEKTGECVIPDDMQSVYPLFRDAHVILLSSPMYFYGFPAQAKALIDRSQALWCRRRLEKAPDRLKTYDGGEGYIIAVGATKGKNLFDGAQLTARYFFDALDMAYKGGIFFRELEEKGAVVSRPDYLKQAFELGRCAIEGK